MAVLGAAGGLLLALSLLAFGLYCCYVKYIHAKYDHIPGAPRESFLFGHLPILWRMLRKREFMHDLFLQWAEKYGPIVRLNAFHRVSVMILSPEGVKEFLMSPQYPKDRLVYGRIFNLFGERFLGNGLVTVCNHEHWHKQRKIMDPAFSRTYLIGLMETFNEKAEDLMEKLEEKADGKKEFSMLLMMNRVTMDIIAKVAFGLELNALSDDQTPFPHAVTVVLEGMTKTRIPLFQYMPGKQKLVKEVKESLRLLRRVGKECIDRRREAIQNGKEATLDILTQILKGDALEVTRDDENILDNFITFFVAGHETTANQLSFTVMALAQHPEILERLQAEVDDVLGAKRDIGYEDLGKLTYLSQNKLGSVQPKSQSPLVRASPSLEYQETMGLLSCRSGFEGITATLPTRPRDGALDGEGACHQWHQNSCKHNARFQHLYNGKDGKIFQGSTHFQSRPI